MIDFILGGIIIVLIAGFGWYVHETNRERSKLVNSLLSKTPQDYVNMTLADQTQIKPEVKHEDIVTEDQLSQDEWEDRLADSLSNKVEDEQII